MNGELTYKIKVTDEDRQFAKALEWCVVDRCPWELNASDIVSILYAMADNKDGANTDNGYIPFERSEE